MSSCGGHDVFGASLPGTLNAINGIAYFYRLYGAYKQNPHVTALGGSVALTCKLVYLHVLVRYYHKNAQAQVGVEYTD